MKIEYTLTEQEHADLLDACQPSPCIAINCGMPLSPQEKANLAWERLGKKKGFLPFTVEPVAGKDTRHFKAEPLCLGIEIEPGVFSGCNQSGGDCPRCGK